MPTARSGRSSTTSSPAAGSRRSAASNHAPISPKRPRFLWAAFIVPARPPTWGELHPDLSYGVGLRWRSPVGPLRVDGVRPGGALVRMHLSVGVAF
jgi:translocation and assembly module TamA